jgi:hypothetical protein
MPPGLALSDDPCEHRDLSATQPARLQQMLARLEVYRATSVISSAAHPNPDGRRCPLPAVVASPGKGSP